MSHISLNHLTIAYGDHKVLQDISVDIPDCQIIAILGPSGCGKTTLLKSMNRLLDLHEDVHIEGNILINCLKKITPCWDPFPVLILKWTGLERIPRWTILWNIIFALPVSGMK